MGRFSSLFKSKLFSKKDTAIPDPARRASVSVPTAVRPHFEANSYVPVYLTDEPIYPIVKMVQLSCDGYPGQAVFREDSMLDLNMLPERCGKTFHRMSSNQYRRILMEFNLNLVPPIPAITGAETWVDLGVDELDGALVDITGKREYAVVSKTQLTSWLNEITRVDMARPVQQIDPMDGELKEDSDHINATIRKLTKLRVERRLKDTLALPPMPDIARRLIQLRSNPNANVNMLVRIIETDPTLAATVMRWASSAAYSHVGKIHSLNDAIARVLGYDLVMNLIMGMVLGDVMRVPDHPTTHILGFWEQAIWAAHAAAALSETLPLGRREPKGALYLTGLLHNFGYLVLNHIFPPHFRLITESTDINRHLDVSLVDAHILGITREQVGAQLFKNWSLPEEVIYGVRYQKFADYTGEHHVYANLIYLARALLIRRGITLGSALSVPENLYERLGIDPKEADDKMDALLEQRQRIGDMARMM